MSSRKAIMPALLAVALAAAASCATRPAPEGDPGQVRPLRDFKGLFQGGTISNDNRRNKITFDVAQEDSKITGTFRCAPGNAVCRNNITRGWVGGTVDARGVRVSLQDGSWCLYYFGKLYVGEGDGNYSCYQGGAIVEQGIFTLKQVPPD